MKKPNNIQIALVMGSDSDLLVFKSAVDILDSFNIPFELSILSAHRCPEETVAYAKSLDKRGIEVIVVGAGGAAHIAGIIAANTVLPVIGIPIMSPYLHGIDSLLSTIQMPSGVPVATVGINNSKNAVLLAIQILALKNIKLKKRFLTYKKELSQSVKNKNQKLHEIGITEYLSRWKK